MSDNGSGRDWGDRDARDRSPVLYGGFWRRVGAAILDGMILYLPTAFVLQALGIPLIPPGMEGMGPAEMQSYITNMSQAERDALYAELGRSAIVGAFVNWTYFAFMESSAMQSTLGKMTFGMRVTDLDGNRIGFARATGRFFGKYLSSLIFGIGYLMVAFTERKRGLHDFLAGTLVIRRELPAGPPPQD